MSGHRVIFGGGAQTLYHVPSRGGAPVIVGSATYRIVDLTRIEDDSAYEVVAAGTAATISSVSTTIAADAGRRAADPAVVTVASAVGIAEARRYLLRNSDLQAETATVEDINGTTLRLTGDVKGDYASGSAFLGLELEATFPAAQANDEADFDAGVTCFAVDWTYDGRTTRELVFVVRVRAECPVTAGTLTEYVPSVAKILGGSFQADEFVGAGWRWVRREVAKSGMEIDRLVTDEAIEAAVCYYAAGEIYSLQVGEMSEAAAARYFERADSEIANLTGGVSKPGVVDVAPTGRAVPIPERRGVVATR